MKLSKMRPGQQAIIKSCGTNELFLKLMEMGCLPGELIVMEKIAPLGDPVSVKVSGYSLSLRITEAENIEVELIA